MFLNKFRFVPILVGTGFALIFSRVFASDGSEAGRRYFHGSSERALEMYLETWKEGKSTEAALNASLITAELGNRDQALQLLEDAFRFDPRNDTLRRELSWMYLNQGLPEKAKEIQENRSLNGDDDLVPLTRVRIFLSDGEWKPAKKILQKLNEDHPKLSLAYFYRGLADTLAGHVDDAILSFQQVIKEDSHFIEVRPMLASLFEKKEAPDDAWRQYARLSAADDLNRIAIEGMKRLRNLITQKPEVLVPPRRIYNHTDVPAIPGIETLPKIRVGIGTSSAGRPTHKNSLTFRPSTAFVLWDPETNKELRSFTDLSTWTVRVNPSQRCAEFVQGGGGVAARFWHSIMIKQKNSSATTILNSLEFAPNTSWGGLADKEMRGVIEIRLRGDGNSLTVINHLSIEEYLYGVLAAEMPVYWPLEALKAQAVIARTQAVYRKGLHKKYGYDVCDEQHCQVYTGVAVESEKVRQAVDETRNEILTYQGRPAHTVFSSNCGGFTQSGLQVGWGDIPYWKSFFDGPKPMDQPSSLAELRYWLRSTSPAYCESSKYTWHPEYRWTRVVNVEDLENRLKRKKRIGTIQKILILGRNASGRITKVRFVGSKGVITLTKEHEIRKYFGLGSVRSTLFVVDKVVKNGKLDQVILFGGGWGHGVGFCQSGAAGRADNGQNYKKILEAYYPETNLRSVR